MAVACLQQGPARARARGSGASLAEGLHGLGTVATDERGRLGLAGEDLASAELERRGYEILCRRYRTRFGEIDLVARQGETLVFIEVKTRSSQAFGAPAEAVTARKRMRVRRLATAFLRQHDLGDVCCRFEVVAITVDRQRQVVALDVLDDWFDR